MVTISLSARTEALLRGQIERGRYASIDEAIEDAVDLLEANEKRERLRAAIDHADEQIARGEGIELTDELWEQMQREVDERHRLRQPLSADARP